MRCAVYLVSLVLVGYAAGSLHVIVMGDWGGQASSPYTTPGELNVAKAMEAIAAKLGSNSVLALGDNLYDMGVKNEYDKRFTETFENVYTGATLLNSTFHVLAGNHDHYGNVTGEVEYTKHSKRWSFPSLYYTWTETVTVSGRTASTVTVQFVMIDTVLLAGNTDNSPTAQPPGPEDPQKADDEWTWIDSTLKASTADYLIVAGHYPVWSMAEHGPTGILVSKLKPMFEKYNVTTYLCGHDHNEQYINEGTTVDYHVIGAAHLCDPSTAHSSSIPKDSLKFHFASGTGGFASLTVDSAGLTVIHYDDKGVVQYTTPPHPPRSK